MTNFSKTFDYEQYCSPYMQPYSFIKNKINYDILAIKANMGVGKTQNLHSLIYNYDKVVILSFRISLDVQYTKQLDNFILYSDIPSNFYDTNEYPKMVIQVDSFNKIRGDIDLLILDEITYTMSQLLYSKKREQNYVALEQYLYSNTKIILLDALLENDILDYFSNFNKKILYIDNIYEKHGDKKIVNYNNDYGLFIKNIIEDISNGKKIVFATNSKNELNYLRSKIREKFLNKKKWLFIDCDSDDKLNIEKWDDLDILGYTPTISAGISYVGKNYDKIYGYFVNGSASAEIAVQQLFRIRNLNDSEINICVDITSNEKYPIEDNLLDEHILNKNKFLCKSIDFIKIDHIKNDIIKDNYYYWYKCVIKREYLSFNSYLKRIIELLKSQGITDIVYTGNKDILCDKKQRKNRAEHRKDVKKQENIDIYNADILTTEEYENRRDMINKKRDDKLSCKRYKFKDRAKLEEKDMSPEIIGKFNGNLTKLNNLAYLHYGGKNIRSVLSKRLNYNIKKFNKSDNTYKLHESKRFEKMVWILDIINLYGFDINNILSYKEDDYRIIDKDKIKNYILKNYKNIDYSFGTINKDWNNIFEKDNWFTLLHRYINTKILSMFKISLKRKKINKEEYVSINGLDFWDVVSYDNPILIKEIREQEENMYLQENIVNDEGELDIDAILKVLGKEFGINKCLTCDNETIFNNKLCLNCKLN